MKRLRRRKPAVEAASPGDEYFLQLADIALFEKHCPSENRQIARDVRKESAEIRQHSRELREERLIQGTKKLTLDKKKYPGV